MTTTSAGFRIRAAHPHEAPALSVLALRSKAHWGYDDDFLAACAEELTIQPETCDGIRLEVAEQAGRIRGFYRLAGTPPHGELAALFVDPPDIGTGVGSSLFEAATERARQLHFRSFEIASDPGAEGFYLRKGAVAAGRVPSSSIPGRWLPLLRLDLIPRASRATDRWSPSAPA